MEIYFCLDAGAVVADLDQLYAAGLDADGDLRAPASMELSKFLNNGCRTLDHLTGCDQLGRAYPEHG